MYTFSYAVFEICLGIQQVTRTFVETYLCILGSVSKRHTVAPIKVHLTIYEALKISYLKKAFVP